MNWMQIDKFLYGLINTSKDKDQLYQTVKAHFKWTDAQVESAVGPLLKRSDHVFEKVTSGKEKRVRKKKE